MSTWARFSKPVNAKVHQYLRARFPLKRQPSSSKYQECIASYSLFVAARLVVCPFCGWFCSFTRASSCLVTAFPGLNTTVVFAICWEGLESRVNASLSPVLDSFILNDIYALLFSVFWIHLNSCSSWSIAGCRYPRKSPLQFMKDSVNQLIAYSNKRKFYEKYSRKPKTKLPKIV